MTSLSHCPLQNACLLAGGFAWWQAFPGSFLRATLCRVPRCLFGRGSRIFSRGLVMWRTLLERVLEVLLIMTSGRMLAHRRSLERVLKLKTMPVSGEKSA
jgi:hypothetical protein